MKQHVFLMRLSALLSIGVSGTLIVLKLCAFLLTGSLSILSTLIDSCLDLLVALINALAIYLSLKPADKQHRFGHGKAEAIGSFVQAVFLFISAVYLLFESYRHFQNDTQLTHLPTGVAVMVISIVLTLALTYIQRRIISKTHSMAVMCDCVHYMGDSFMNLGVLCSLGLSYWLGWHWVDEVFAAGVSVYLFHSSCVIFRRVSDILMDRELDSQVRSNIKKLAMIDKDVYGISQLKTRSTGAKMFIQFHVRMNKALDLQQAHDLCQRIEQAIRSAFPQAEVMIHPVPTKQNKFCRLRFK